MLEFRVIPAAGVDQALRVILAAPRAPRIADRRHLRAFRGYLACGPAQWEVCEALEAGRRRAALLGIALPGGTAVLMIPNPGEHDVSGAALAGLLDWWTVRAGTGAFHYEQCLIETDADGKGELLAGAGFQRLTRLVYLERRVAYPWSAAPQDAQVGFVSVQQAGEGALAELLPATYADSLDCPELTGKRPIAAVIAAHKATGVFDPALWQLAQVDGRWAGCVLLAQVAGQPLAEVVYMGVAQAFRRRGLGKLLLERALELCRARGLERLTLVVDERNGPARALYARFGLRPVAQRDAWLRWPGMGRAEIVDNV